MDRKISFAVPYYNNHKFIEKCLKVPLEDERVSEIVIVDDASKDITILQEILNKINSPKIKLYKNKENLGCYHNKILTVSKCTNNWCILFDSDNYFDKDYIDKLYDIEEWNETMIYAPCWAKTFPGSISPNLNYGKYSDTIIDKDIFVKKFHDSNFQCLLNTCNYFLPREQFLRFTDNNYDRNKIDTLDSAILFTDWIASKNKIKVVKDMIYNHRLHPDSNYLKGRSRKFEPDIKKQMFLKIKKLK